MPDRDSGDPARHGGSAQRSGRAARPARRHRASWRLVGVAMLTGVLVILSPTGSAAAWAAAASFVPTATSATWDGDTVTVRFQEVGVDPGASTTILVEATGTVDTVCERDDSVFVSIHSSATSTDVSDYLADANGTVTDTRELAVTLRPPTITGLGCTTRVVRTLSVVLHDLDTGARLVLSGSTTGGPPGAVVALPPR